MKKTMIEAFELKRQGYYKQAVEIYYKLLSETDDSIEILAELADLYFLMNNFNKAGHYIEKVLELDKNHVNTLKIQRDIYLKSNSDIEAINIQKRIFDITKDSESKLELLQLFYKHKNYERVLEYSSEDDDMACKLIRAKSLFELENYDEAKLLCESSSNCEEQLLLLGKIYSKMGEMGKVKEVYKKLKELDLSNSESLNFVGLNYMEELELDKAIECFNKAIELKNNEAMYHYNLGQSYFLKGWIEEAQKSFNTAICLNPMEENYHYSLAYLLYRIGDFENALMHLNGCDEGNLNSKILKLVIQAEKGDLAFPKIELEKMLKDNKDNELILFSLAKIYYKLDMYKQAKTLIEDVLKINPKSFEYQEYYVKLLLILRDLDEAKLKIDEMLEKYPAYYYAKVLEAEYYLLVQDYDSLFDTAQELIELDMNHYEGYYYNAISLFEKDDLNFAIESLKKAITLNVDNASLYIKMAEFYQELGRYEDAFEYIKEASDIDKSAKNKELYMQLSALVRKRKLD